MIDEQDGATETGRRVLVATGAAVAGVDDIPVLVRTLLDSASEILVITPILPGRLEWLASATDRARQRADERLDTFSDRCIRWAWEPRGASATRRH